LYERYAPNSISEALTLNRLPVFEAVYEEKRLSRAAVRLAMTQSAISHALSRLRFVFRDELFVRQSRGVIPTRTADRVYTKVRDALASVRESVTDTRTFEPKTSERRFALSIPHPLGPIIELRLQERLARIAPKVAVSASTRSRPIDLDDALREGRVTCDRRLAPWQRFQLQPLRCRSRWLPGAAFRARVDELQAGSLARRAPTSAVAPRIFKRCVSTNSTWCQSLQN
jgi:DNA-binding transcriptional LysR family regulator